MWVICNADGVWLSRNGWTENKKEALRLNPEEAQRCLRTISGTTALRIDVATGGSAPAQAARIGRKTAA